MQFSLSLDSNNDAFADDSYAEVARILRDAADRVESGSFGGNLRDLNGNKVGRFDVGS